MYSMLLSKAFLNGLQYRARYLLSLAGSFIYRFVTMNLWVALYASVDQPGGVSQMSTYILLTALIGHFSLQDVGVQFGRRIISGDIAMDLIKPYNVRYYFLCQSLGNSLFSLAFVTLPVMVVVCVVYPPVVPVSALAGVMCVLLALSGAFIGFYLNYILGLWVFWLKNDWYIDWIRGALMTLFGGSIVPLWMYPDWLLQISRFLPFRYIRYEAVAVYLGQSTEPFVALTIQLVWLGMFILLERVIWRAAQRKIFVLGG